MKAFNTRNTIAVRTTASVVALMIVSHAAQARLDESENKTSVTGRVHAQHHEDQKLASSKQKKSSEQGVRSIPYATPEAPIPPPSSHK
jgi:hypothetical protein